MITGAFESIENLEAAIVYHQSKMDESEETIKNKAESKLRHIAT